MQRSTDCPAACRSYLAERFQAKFNTPRRYNFETVVAVFLHRGSHNFQEAFACHPRGEGEKRCRLMAADI
jgi:hypothetical protein